jgi:hypothetical protein
MYNLLSPYRLLISTLRRDIGSDHTAQQHQLKNPAATAHCSSTPAAANAAVALRAVMLKHSSSGDRGSTLLQYCVAAAVTAVQERYCVIVCAVQ